jgi:hypothetical protein
MLIEFFKKLEKSKWLPWVGTAPFILIPIVIMFDGELARGVGILAFFASMWGGIILGGKFAQIISTRVFNVSDDVAKRLAEVHRLGRHEYLHPVRRVDHNEATISAMRTAGVSPAKRIVMSPIITSRVPEDGDGGQTGFNALGSSICTGTNSMPSKLGKTSLPVRAMRRQSETLLGIKPYRLATPFTVAPSISVYATIRAFSSRGQRRLPSELHGILARNSFLASIEKLPSNL